VALRNVTSRWLTRDILRQTDIYISELLQYRQHAYTTTAKGKGEETEGKGGGKERKEGKRREGKEDRRKYGKEGKDRERRRNRQGILIGIYHRPLRPKNCRKTAIFT